MTYSVFDIANWFLNKESMQQKKLQKLCYYAKAWSLVLLNNDLLDFSFQAWAHGPVNVELWTKCKNYGYLDIESDKFLSNSKEIDGKVNELLILVWNTYGEFNGFQLESLTHSELPWINARNGIADLEPSKNIIKNIDMKEYYSKIYSGEGIGE